MISRTLSEAEARQIKAEKENKPNAKNQFKQKQ